MELYLIGGGGFLALLAALIRHVRRWDDEAKKVAREIIIDLSDIARDAFNCFMHTVVLYVFFVAISIPTDTALATSISVGAMRLFSSDDVHARHYLHRTRVRLCRWWWCREDADE